MYFCLRRRERRYRNFLKGIPRPRPRALGENPSEEREDSAEGDIQNNESVDSAVPQPVQSSVDDYYKHSKDFKMLLHAKCVKKNGKIAYMSRSFRIVCVYVTEVDPPRDLVRYFYMKKEVKQQSITEIRQFGLYKSGALKPLPADKREYEIVKMSTDDDSKTIVSNNVESEVNKLYLKITNKDDTIKVIVAKNANNSSYFNLTKLQNGKYVFETATYPGYALKYNEDISDSVIVGKHDAVDLNQISDDYQFQLQEWNPPSWKHKLCPSF